MLLALRQAVTLSCAHAVPSWLGKSAATGTLGSFAGANPFKFLHAIAQMSDLEQRIYLEMIGEGLKVHRTPTGLSVTYKCLHRVLDT